MLWHAALFSMYGQRQQNSVVLVLSVRQFFNHRNVVRAADFFTCRTATMRLWWMNSFPQA